MMTGYELLVDKEIVVLEGDWGRDIPYEFLKEFQYFGMRDPLHHFNHYKDDDWV